MGSLEGRSAIFWLEYLPCLTITCIDTFEGIGIFAGDIEGRFDRNLAAYGQRVRKIKSTSATALARLAEDGARFDLAYIDGDHSRDNVMIDCLLAWRMLRPGGLIILDDYELDLRKSPAKRPLDAIDTFLQWHAGEHCELHRGFQIIIRRLP